jgi:hypothetical protein
MADTQRDGRGDGRTNGGRADRPDRAPLRVPTRVLWRVESPADGGQEPQRPRQFGPRFWLILPTGTGPARCGRLQAPRGAPALSENGSVKPSFVMRPLAMVVTSRCCVATIGVVPLPRRTASSMHASVVGPAGQHGRLVADFDATETMDQAARISGPPLGRLRAQPCRSGGRAAPLSGRGCPRARRSMGPPAQRTKRDD